MQSTHRPRDALPAHTWRGSCSGVSQTELAVQGDFHQSVPLGQAASVGTSSLPRVSSGEAFPKRPLGQSWLPVPIPELGTLGFILPVGVGMRPGSWTRSASAGAESWGNVS